MLHSSSAAIYSVWYLRAERALSTRLLACLGLTVAVGDVGSNPRSVHDVEQGEVFDLARELQQEGHGLSDATRSAHHGHLGTAQRERKSTREKGRDGTKVVVNRKCSVSAVLLT